MAYKVQIARIEGREAITADGKRLKIINNVIPHGYAYTDGTVIYGYNTPEYVAPPAPKKKLIAPFYIFQNYQADDPYDGETVYACYIDRDGTQQYIRETPEASPTWWLWDKAGVTFANTEKRAYTRKDDYTQNRPTHTYIDDQGNALMTAYTDACVLAITKDGYMAQTGDYRAVQRATTVSWWDRYGTHAQDVTSVYDWTGSERPLRGIEHDLSYEANSTAVKSGNITDILDLLFADLRTELAEKQGTPPQYPQVPPDPAILDMAIYPDNGFVYRTAWTGFDAYGDRRMEYCGDAPPLLWLTVSAVAYGGTKTQDGHTGWWPTIYRYNLGIQPNDTYTGYTVAYRNVEEAEYIAEANLQYLNFRQTEHAEAGYTVAYNGYAWKQGTLKKGDTFIATIPDRPHGICKNGNAVLVLTDTALYAIKGGTVTTQAITPPVQGDPLHSDNGTLAPIDDIRKVWQAWDNAYA